jgi:L-seryl-tRNA(Ser) seleniumtransferase
MTTIYEKYNLNKVINASGKMTALGVSKYVDEAMEAQQLGGKNFFEMDQLNINVGQYVADLLGAEDAQIVSSAAAGIAQSVAALIGQGSQYHLYNPYSERITRREIIVPKGHNVDFGAPIQTMIELGGGKVVEAGYANTCTPDLIEDQMTENTAAILYVKSHHSVQKSMLSVQEAAEVAGKHGIPLVVDAAAEQEMKLYLELGADLVIFSGAKALEGTSSGVVYGNKEYVEWVRLQGSGIGRAMKIGKENILGLAAAIERYLEVGPETGEQMIERLKPFLNDLEELPYIQAKMVQDLAGRDIYRAQVTFEEGVSKTAAEVADELTSGSPAVYTRNHQINNGIIEFDIRSVNEEEMKQIVDKLEKIVTK